ncbi:MAG: Ldh family oxidoreductase [Bacteroidales bacterium]|nr:Ldh family oxidoreductase [Bacteroidales bacterium]
MVTHTNLRAYVAMLFERMGCPAAHAAEVAELLVAAELRGIPSHGLMRVKDYYQMAKAGRINPQPQPKVVHQTPSTATVDGDNALGPVPGLQAMRLAIEKAQQCGTGWVAVRNSNHFGIAGHYAMMALPHDMIGIALTNANPLVVPTNSISKYLGTNPIAVAIPAQQQPPFVADFATTPIARGKLALMGKKGQRAPMGLLQDAEGHPTDDPDILMRGGGIMPLGGDVEHGGHKGFCLTALVDIFSSVLGGANFGPFVPPQVPYLPPNDRQVGEGLGHFFGAMRVDAFRPSSEFKASMDEWITTFRAAQRGPEQPPVQIPGDAERLNTEHHLQQGIAIIPQVLADLNEVADELGVERIMPHPHHPLNQD